MCGIVGYVGNRDATAVLLEGLQALEYRGYDSAGVYMPQMGSQKAVGPVLNLIRKIGEQSGGASGIAHTRWATHGAPTEANAHPHRDQDGLVWVVHNGIIENYRELREWLAEQGRRTYYSDTDTEVLAQYIGLLVSTGMRLERAVREALRHVRGTYGLAVMSAQSSDEIVLARMGSPLVIGIAPHGHMVASDPTALLAHTKEVVYLEDGQCAVVRADRFEIFDTERNGYTPTVTTIEWNQDVAERGGYEHFMLKEIMEGPDVIRNTMRGRLRAEQGDVKLGGLEDVKKQLSHLKHLSIVGCGSAYYAGLVGKYILEKYARIPVEVEIASEFRYRQGIERDESALLAISQSGETADTLASIREAKRRKMTTLGIVNAVGSTIARETDAGVYNHAGPEMGVASTKAFISQVSVLSMLSVFLGKMRHMSEETARELTRALSELPEHIQHILDQREMIRDIAQSYAHARDMLYVGRGSCMPIALEGALKLKEVSYVHAEGYGAGEMKHGPIAMIDAAFPTVALVPQNELYEKNISNIQEIRARSGPVIAIATEGDDAVTELASHVIYIPQVHEVVQPIVATIPLQLFAYYIGIAKGYDVDRPRNLAKSVTVE